VKKEEKGAGRNERVRMKGTVRQRCGQKANNNINNSIREQR